VSTTDVSPGADGAGNQRRGRRSAGSADRGATRTARTTTDDAVSSADTGYFYVTKKNPRTKTNKLELKKFDPVARKHVIFKEAKIK